MATNAKVYGTLTSVLPQDLVARGLLALSRHPSIARQRGFRGSVGNASVRFAHIRAAFDEVDIPIAPSRFLIDMFGQNGYPAERIRHSPYGMDLSWLPLLRPRDPGAPLCFGYIGQIDPLKGVDVLVKAFGMAAPGGMVTLDVYGDLTKRPAYSDELRLLAQGNPNVRFKGSFTRSQIADVLSGIDVVVVPSMWYENTPLVILEAFAAGKPVIATNLGGMSEIVDDGVNGLLFERGDAPGLADAIRRIVTDRTLLARLARQVPPVRTIEAETEDLLRTYRQVVASRQASPW
jgi:glycosyltransferase involved in cell wall biosynthesis